MHRIIVLGKCYYVEKQDLCGTSEENDGFTGSTFDDLERLAMLSVLRIRIRIRIRSDPGPGFPPISVTFSDYFNV